MQGKFKLVVLQNTGHSVQEDNYFGLAQSLHQFLTQFRIPTSVEEIGILKEMGIGKFHP